MTQTSGTPAPVPPAAPPASEQPSSVPAPRRPGRVHRAWWVAAVAFVALVGAAAFRAAPSVLIDPLHTEFGWSRGTISAAVSVNLVLYGLTAPFAAALMERFGMRKVVASALLLVAAGSGLTVFMNASWQLILCWGVLVGLGTGSMALAFVATVVGRWFDARQGLVTGVLTAGGAAGQLVFLPLVAWLTERHGWRPATLSVTFAALAVVPLVLWLLRDRPEDVGTTRYGASGHEGDARDVHTPQHESNPRHGPTPQHGPNPQHEPDSRSAPGAPPVHGSQRAHSPDNASNAKRAHDARQVHDPQEAHDPRHARPVAASGAGGPVVPVPGGGAAARALGALRDASRTKTFWLLAGTFAICGASTNGLIGTHFVPAAHDHGMPVTTAAGLLAVIGVFDLVGTIASGWFTDRFDPRGLLAVYYGLRGVSLLFLPLLLVGSVQPPMLFFIVFYGLDWVATVPPTVALCRKHFGADGAIVFGWVLAAHQVGAGLVAFLTGLVRDVTGSYDTAWYTSGALCAVAALMALVIRRSPERTAAFHG
ncbi:MFS transporter [Streptomyces sp. Ru87]|uniref:MFS transporter n=1 Tax=Streptomyces sp. Ru87 TaxID=2044307 RepID=UPI0011802C85|nr:MFS transporter [Streptomyces sp. Ru87]